MGTVGDVAVQTDVDAVDGNLAGLRSDHIDGHRVAAHLGGQIEKSGVSAEIAHKIVAGAAGDAGDLDIFLMDGAADRLVERPVSAAGIEAETPAGLRTAGDQARGIAGEAGFIQGIRNTGLFGRGADAGNQLRNHTAAACRRIQKENMIHAQSPHRCFLPV